LREILLWHVGGGPAKDYQDANGITAAAYKAHVRRVLARTGDAKRLADVVTHVLRGE
jgi:hypothetical protein